MQLNFSSELLADGPVGATDAEEAATKEGISSRTLRRARKKLGIVEKGRFRRRLVMVALAPKGPRWPTKMANSIIWPPLLSLVQFLVLLLGKAQGGQPQKMSPAEGAKF